MNWKSYSHLKNSHAFLSPSKYHWLHYDESKLVTTYRNFKKISLGSQYHDIASRLIKLAIRLPPNGATLNSFVNDAIGYKMESEMVLYYSPNCYGTADAISFRDGVLRIHDLKTGSSNASMDQLMIYAALFVLDYAVSNKELKETVLRIYQNDEIIEFNPSTKDVFTVVSIIIRADKIINQLEKTIL